MRQSLFGFPVILLLTAPLAAQGTEPAFENVYVDVEGAAVQIPVALAAEACGSDEDTIRADALRLLEESGSGIALLAQRPLGNASDPAQAVTGVEATAAETGTQPDGASATAEGQSAAAAGSGSGVPTADADEAPSNETVTTAQGTADPSTAEPSGEFLALAVCQVDVEAAASLGIPQANEIVTD